VESDVGVIRRRDIVLQGLTLMGALSGVREALAQQSVGGSRWTGRAPVLFVGHGSPMNAVADNSFTRMLRAQGGAMGKPRAILVVSAHWVSEGATGVSVQEQQSAIYDFGGFPSYMYEQRYDAPGAPGAAVAAAKKLTGQQTGGVRRGLDHGAWSVLKHLYPTADVPVFQMSMDFEKNGAWHVNAGRAMGELRREGVMVLASGNVVHNLGATMRGVADSERGRTRWADEFDQTVKKAIDDGDRRFLGKVDSVPGIEQAHPFPDHYMPLLYAIGAAGEEERPTHVYEGFQSGTLSMRCVRWG